MRFKNWLEENHSKFDGLTETVVLIMTRLLKDTGIPYLTITGRTKDIQSCLDKARKKRYRNPIDQMTDISGVRVVVFFDYDIERVNLIIEENFSVDRANSSNRDEILLINQVGYRSVHYVCDLGADRLRLREHQSLAHLKFEFQVRTVLQHAWAELAHDKNYKFSGQLPKHLERKLFLLAGLMETADNGFSELSRQIDEYIQEISTATPQEILEIEINALSLSEFVTKWAKNNGLPVSDIKDKVYFNDLVRELGEFGIENLKELEELIPNDFPEKFGKSDTSVLGIVRDWMIISDPKRFINDVKIDWSLTAEDIDLYEKYLDSELVKLIVDNIDTYPSEDSWDEDAEH